VIDVSFKWVDPVHLLGYELSSPLVLGGMGYDLEVAMSGLFYTDFDPMSDAG